MKNNSRFKYTALVGPSGGGKTAIATKMVANSYGEMCRCITVTSRDMRGTEKDYVDYIYLSYEGFMNVADAGLFYEWEKPYGTKCYGTPRGIFDAIVDQGKSPLLNIDINGYRSMKKIFGDKLFGVFINTPIETVRYFLEQRGDTSKQDIERRIARAIQEEYPCMGELDYIQPNGIGHDLDLIANNLLNRALRV